MKINIFWEEETEGEKGNPLRLKPQFVRETAKKILADLKIKGKELNIIFCSSAYMRKLAKQYRGKDYAPATLSFPLVEKGLLGEIYLNYECLSNFPITYLLRHSLGRMGLKAKKRGDSQK
jgi:ssRNA-specific RNase YbeY (16S rRNA maturation enzyme)